jgi:ribosomal protein L6P/L9E
MLLKKNELIIIPSYISIFYFKRKKILVFKSSDKFQFLEIHFLLDLLMLKNKCYIIINFKNKKLNQRETKLTLIKQNLLSLTIKQCLVETNNRFYKKLNLVGVGYKVFKAKSINHNEILLFKLGFSHLIYIRIDKTDHDLVCLKNTKLFITGDVVKVNKLSALIKSFKKPESYKGKGIRFQDEKITLKQIKKK